MVEESDNLLIKLHKLASGQDENFLTEVLANLLRRLIAIEPQAALTIINLITNNRLNVDIKEIVSVNVITQVSTENGRPDILISTDDHIAYIEVKVESDFGDDQIERYRLQLDNCDFKETSLIVLTRYPFYERLYNCNPDFNFRWHDLVDWLKSLKICNDLTLFHINQFVDFLYVRGLAMQQVSWELVPGVKSFQTLTDMIEEALAAKKVNIHQRSAAWEWRGFYIEQKRFFIGLYLSDPNLVVINTEEVSLSSNIPKEVTLGRLIGNWRWQNELDLTSEEVHFFARSKASQIQCLEKFIEESLSYGRTLIKP